MIMKKYIYHRIEERKELLFVLLFIASIKVIGGFGEYVKEFFCRRRICYNSL